MINKSYKEYKLNIGDAKFTFFMDSGSIFENMASAASVHSHAFYELFYVTKGEVVINNIILPENCAALLPCEYNHNSKTYENSQRIVISFNIEKSKNKSQKNIMTPSIKYVKKC